MAYWIEDSYVALAAANLSDVPAGADEKTVKASVEAGYGHVDYAQRKALTAEYFAFLSRMKVGDLVAVPRDTAVHVGAIDGDPRYVAGTTDRLRRRVQWRAEVEADRVAGLGGLLDLQGTLVDITQGLDLLEELIGTPPVDDDEVPDDEPVVVDRKVADAVPLLPVVGADLAGKLHMKQAHLQELVDLLQSRHVVGAGGPQPGSAGAVPPVVRVRGLLRGVPPGGDRAGAGDVRADTGTPAADRVGCGCEPGYAVRVGHRRVEPGEPGEGVRGAVLPVGVPQRVDRVAVQPLGGVPAAEEPVRHRHDEHRRPVDRAAGCGDAAPVPVRGAASGRAAGAGRAGELARGERPRR